VHGRTVRFFRCGGAGDRAAATNRAALQQSPGGWPFPEPDPARPIGAELAKRYRAAAG
jgi:hypothetical protein